MIDLRKNIRELIAFLYGQNQANDLLNSLWLQIETFKRNYPQFQTNFSSNDQLTEKDVILITYADQFRESQRPPLESLNTFLQSNLQNVISGVHILPFYPYSSDDGFSVIDFRRVCY